MRTWGTILAGSGVSAGLGWLGGCSAPMEQASFQAATPKARAAAVAQAAAEGDAGAIPDLIEALDDGDPVVRSWAIHALEQMTGQRLGYDPYAPPGLRDDAVDRWVQWRLGAAGSDTVTGGGGSGPSPAGAEPPR